MAFLYSASLTNNFDNTCPSWENELVPVTKLLIVWSKGTPEATWTKVANDIIKHTGKLIDGYGGDLEGESRELREKREKLKGRMGKKSFRDVSQGQVSGVPSILGRQVLDYARSTHKSEIDSIEMDSVMNALRAG